MELMQSAVKKVRTLNYLNLGAKNGENLLFCEINLFSSPGDRLRERGAPEAPRGESAGRPKDVPHPARRRLRHPVPAAADGGRGRLLLHRQWQGEALQGHQDPRGR